MCRGCWEEDGRPTELPPSGPKLIELINHLYDMPGCSTGGPLHVVFEDFNLDDDCLADCPLTPDDFDYPPEVLDLARTITAMLAAIPERQRAAVIAKREGWSDPPTPGDRCPWCPPGAPGQIVYAALLGPDRKPVWACPQHTAQVVVFQTGRGITATVHAVSAAPPYWHGEDRTHELHSDPAAALLFQEAARQGAATRRPSPDRGRRTGDR